ncbi:hypothetical protein BTZ20_1647 [Rhodococcus sp. MTM3W5.2]|nr:hypothetical protein BTZ20_1647 [Rhodococcus sp. MTM3W5.2]
MISVTGVARVTSLSVLATMTFVAVAAVIVHLVAADDRRLIVSVPRIFGGCLMSGMSSAIRSHDPTIYP